MVMEYMVLLLQLLSSPVLQALSLPVLPHLKHPCPFPCVPVLAAAGVWDAALWLPLGPATSALGAASVLCGVRDGRAGLGSAVAGALGRESHSLGAFVQSRDQWPAVMTCNTFRLPNTFVASPNPFLIAI